MDAYPDWFANAECRTYPKAVFYPVNQSAMVGPLAVCAFCTVVADCRAYAIANGEEFGVWGGLDPATLRSARPKAVVPAPLVHGTSEAAPTCRRRPDGLCHDCRMVMLRSA